MQFNARQNCTNEQKTKWFLLFSLSLHYFESFTTNTFAIPFYRIALKIFLFLINIIIISSSALVFFSFVRLNLLVSLGLRALEISLHSFISNWVEDSGYNIHARFMFSLSHTHTQTRLDLHTTNSVRRTLRAYRALTASKHHTKPDRIISYLLPPRCLASSFPFYLLHPLEWKACGWGHSRKCN